MRDIGLESELGQRPHDIDQTILHRVFELGVVSAHNAAADAANPGRDLSQELPQRKVIALQGLSYVFV